MGGGQRSDAVTAPDLKKMNVCDVIVPEPGEGAHEQRPFVFAEVEKEVAQALTELQRVRRKDIAELGIGDSGTWDGSSFGRIRGIQEKNRSNYGRNENPRMGQCHGDRCVSNEDMKQYVDTSDEWIRSKTGIGQRYFAENKSNLDMAAEAGAKAVAHLTPEEKSEIDGLVVATFTPDMATPSMAAEVAGRLAFPER